MARDEYIRDFAGVILGIIKHTDNGDKMALSFPAMQILGYYKAEYNHTTNFAGQILSRGDTVVSLIYEDLAKNKK